MTGQARGAASGVCRVHPARRPRTSGKLEPGEGETTQAIRRRLTAAAGTLGKTLVSRRSAAAIYFWPPEDRRAATGPARKST